MKTIPAFLILIALLVSCGCMEPPPAPPASTPVPGTITTTPAAVPPATVPPVIVTPSRTASVSDNTIIIFKNTFQPANITVTAGSTVRWVNNDNHPHRIQFMNKEFSTSTYLLGATESFSQVFFRPGQYDFACMIHPEMQGSVLVEP